MATTKDLQKYSSCSFDELINTILDQESEISDLKSEIENLKDEIYNMEEKK